MPEATVAVKLLDDIKESGKAINTCQLTGEIMLEQNAIQWGKVEDRGPQQVKIFGETSNGTIEGDLILRTGKETKKGDPKLVILDENFNEKLKELQNIKDAQAITEVILLTKITLDEAKMRRLFSTFDKLPVEARFHLRLSTQVKIEKKALDLLHDACCDETHPIRHFVNSFYCGNYTIYSADEPMTKVRDSGGKSINIGDYYFGKEANSQLDKISERLKGPSLDGNMAVLGITATVIFALVLGLEFAFGEPIGLAIGAVAVVANAAAGYLLTEKAEAGEYLRSKHQKYCEDQENKKWLESHPQDPSLSLKRDPSFDSLDFNNPNNPTVLSTLNPVYTQTTPNNTNA